jgi:hypothetical protein
MWGTPGCENGSGCIVIFVYIMRWTEYVAFFGDERTIYKILI